MTTNKKTIKNAVKDIRECFLEVIFENYPHHKKTWTADEVDRAFSTAVYSVACSYLDRIEKEKKL
jgi:hypothetical protein